ncbi:Ankyrin repeats (3 copies) [Gimesia alba]|uniref:Ankyrin repeats (3 copies) n=1 Tax=Gimesia alba TaxID=2527973 RepID=A0A517RMZ2_9PLAN|nr:ankyrin repeat domain-containing protein [Gimesia alba]QDT45248.1 Ankyrin repeats (3 copies) [Gimesia alba]
MSVKQIIYQRQRGCWTFYVLFCCCQILLTGCSKQEGASVQEFDPPASTEFDPQELEEARKTLTPLQFSIEYGTFEEVQQALQENPDSIHEPTEFGNMPLHLAVHQGKIKEVELLLKSGADMNARGDYGETPLHVALKDERYELVRLLLTNGADPNKPNDREVAPLSYARDPDYYKLLVDHGARVDLPIVMGLGNCERARHMLAEDPQLVRSLSPKVKERILSDGISMIHFKHERGLLNQYGDQINLQFATGGKFDQHFRKVIAENRDILETLTSQGAPRSFRMQEIDLAIMQNQTPLVELLLEYGAEFPAEDDARRWSFIMSGRRMGLPNLDKSQIIKKYKPFIDKQRREN